MKSASWLCIDHVFSLYFSMRMPAGLTNLIQLSKTQNWPKKEPQDFVWGHPTGTVSKKVHKEANIPAVKDIQIRLASGILKNAKENKIESILVFTQKKRTSEKQLPKHIGPSVLLTIFTLNFDKIFVCTNDHIKQTSAKTVRVQWASS